ncbi:MAG: hypothetical protein JSW06_00715 [Thermoplasmatales archaeon]|nr:MAG: hypothetical protein JSW06_00715 [Thermoplasmatales archaeon]
MERNNLIKKVVVVAVILLFIGLAFAPSINADVSTISRINTIIIKPQDKTVTLTCRYFTFEGVEEIEKEVSSKDAEKLFTLMDDTDYDTISRILNSLGLIPKSMTVDKVVELINGEQGRRQYNQLIERLQRTFFFRDESEWKENVLCLVQGGAVDNIFYGPLTFMIEYGAAVGYAVLLGILFTLDTLFQIFPWYPVGDPPFEFGPLLILALMLGAMYGALIEGWPLHYLIPLKIAPVVFAGLSDSFPVHQNPNLTSTGLLGRWEICDYQDIALLMIGFTGLWISYFDGYQFPACKFMGFSLYAKAKGINPE